MSNFSEPTKKYYRDYLKDKLGLVLTEEELESDLQSFAELFYIFAGLDSDGRALD